MSEASLPGSDGVRPRRAPVRWRRWAVWLIRLRGTPHAIAGGLAVGTLVTFSPTIGLQTILALGLATLLRVSRPVSLVPTWLTNPITIPPVYAFTYWVGSFILPGPSVAEVTRALHDVRVQLAHSDFFALREQVGVLLDLGRDVLGPMAVGGLVVGGVAAVIVYATTLWAVSQLHRHRGAGRRSRRAPAAAMPRPSIPGGARSGAGGAATALAPGGPRALESASAARAEPRSQGPVRITGSVNPVRSGRKQR